MVKSQGQCQCHFRNNLPQMPTGVSTLTGGIASMCYESVGYTNGFLRSCVQTKQQHPYGMPVHRPMHVTTTSQVGDFVGKS